MTVLFAGSSIADVSPAQGTPTPVTNSAYKTSTCLEGIDTGYYQDGFRITLPTPLREVYTSGHVRRPGMTTTGAPYPFRFYAVDGTTLIRLRVTNSSTLILDIWNGTTWVAAATSLVVPGVGVVNRFDIYVKLGVTDGRFRLKWENQVVLDFTGQTDYGIADIASLTFSSYGASSSYYSGMVVADEPTDLMVVHQMLPTGNGAETAWTGDYTAVDETGANDGDFIQATAADQVETFTFSQLGSEWAAYEIKAVTLGMRAVGGAATPTVEGVARVDGVNYAQPSQLPTPPAFGPVNVVFETNPANDSTWTRDVVNAAQFGVKAVA